MNILLNRFFGFSDEKIIIPTKNVRSQWTMENKHGFLMGVSLYGQPCHIEMLGKLVLTNDRRAMDDFIIICYLFYIDPFHQQRGNTCTTPDPEFFDLSSPEAIS